MCVERIAVNTLFTVRSETDPLNVGESASLVCLASLPSVRKIYFRQLKNQMDLGVVTMLDVKR